MAKILGIIVPLRSHMHTIPKLAISLRERGHEVLFAGMADCKPIVSPYGFECIPMFTEWFPEGIMGEWLCGSTTRKSWKDSLQGYMDERRKFIDYERYIDYLIQGGYREFEKVIREIAPDLILVDIGLHAHWALMAYRSGVNCLYISTVLPTRKDPIMPPLNSLLRPGNGLRSRLNIKLAWNNYFARRWLRDRAMRLAGISDPTAHIKELAHACGYPLERLNTHTMLFPQLDFPMIVMCPEEFDFPEARRQANIHYIEAAIDPDRSEPDFPWEKLEADKKLIFCALGSIVYNQRFFQHVIDAVAKEPGWQLVMNIGPQLSRADFAGVPENAVLVNGAPQLGLLKRAQAMINHGGISSVRECIYFGVPQVVFPVGFDTPGAASRVQYHGLGLVGSFRDATAETIHSLLSQLLQDESFRSRAKAMSQIFQAREKQQLGATTIERFLPG
jgi:zeaxanthin glucosyltransferase